MQTIANMHKNDISKYIVGQYPEALSQNTENYYNFGQSYYSKVNNVPNKSIIWHFPLNELRPNEIIYYLSNDIFPTSWSLFGSNDGTNWTELIYSNHSMCPLDQQYPIKKDEILWKYYCNKVKVVFPFENTQPYKYMKYTQYKNSMIVDTPDKNSIINYGIDFGGIFTADYFICTCYNLYSSVNLISLNIYCLIILYL